MQAADGIKAPPALKARLRKLGLVSNNDLVLHLPLRYEDETQLALIASALSGSPVQIEAEVLEVSVQFCPRRQLVARVADCSGELTLRFLNFYGSQTKQLERARDDRQKLRLFGEIRHGFLGAEMVHPRYRVVTDGEALPEALTPVYPSFVAEGVAGVARRPPARRYRSSKRDNLRSNTDIDSQLSFLTCSLRKSGSCSCLSATNERR